MSINLNTHLLSELHIRPGLGLELLRYLQQLWRGAILSAKHLKDHSLTPHTTPPPVTNFCRAESIISSSGTT